MAECQRKADEVIGVDQVFRGCIQVKLGKYPGKNTQLPFVATGFFAPAVETEITTYADQGRVEAGGGRIHVHKGEGAL